MPSYSVRAVISWSPRVGQKRQYLYEERITAWKADSLDEAIELAEFEAQAYAEREGFVALSFLQAYWMPTEIGQIAQGCEIYSLLRESDLEKDEYLDRFFDTGEERQSDYWDDKQ